MSNNNIKRLSERFPTEAHAQRKQGSRMLTYLGIEHVIGRLNEVFGDSYSTEITNSQLQGDWAIVSVRITYTDDSGATRWKDGIGADMWTYVDSYGKTQVDMDKALKTAYAEGIKKAGHQLGVGLYLWDDDIRKEVEQEMRNPSPQQKREQRPSGNAMDRPKVEDSEAAKLLDSTLKEIKRSGCPAELFTDWAKSKGYPLKRAEMTVSQLQDALSYLQTLPNATKTA